MSNTNDFSQRPFVAGSLIGIRSWKIDSHARLTGVSYEDVWIPGVNSAVCHATPAVDPVRPAPPVKIAVPDDKTTQWEYALPRPYQGIKVKLSNRPAPLSPTTPRAFYTVLDPTGLDVYTGAKPPHDVVQMVSALQQAAPASIMNAKGAVTFSGQIERTTPETDTPEEEAVDPNAPKIADLDCQCGYYAYFDTLSNPHHRDGMITGIIEAWGTCTVGGRGFRASKAQIKGLIMPPDHPLQWERIRDNYSDIPLFDYAWQAIRAFPLTNQNEPPSPTTQADFWTMP